MKLLLSFIFLSTPLLAQAKKVDLSELSEKSLSALLENQPTLTGDSVAESELDQSIQFLVRKKYYDYASVSKTADGYKLHVEADLKISQIKSQGNDFLSNSDIRKISGLEENMTYDSHSLSLAKEKLLSHYRENGYSNCEIEIEIQKKLNEIELTFIIIENQTTRLYSATINSENQKLKKELEKLLNKEENSTYSEKLVFDLSKKIQTFLSENRYYKSEVSQPQITFSHDKYRVYLTWSIESPFQYSITYSGSMPLSRWQLTDHLDLENYKSSNPNIALELAHRVKTYYLSKGYARTEVKATEVGDANSYTKKIDIHIESGSLVKIALFEIKGHYSLPENEYLKILKILSTGPIKNDIYVAEDLDQALKGLILDRQNHGYLKARVISSRRIYSTPNKDRMSITINLDEGPLTQVQKISFQGNHAINEADLLRILKENQIEPQKALLLGSIDQMINDILEFYHSRGYIDMQITNSSEDLLEFSEDGTLAHLIIKISEGPQVTVATIVIEGNTFTKDYVILKQLDFSVGEILTPSAMSESIRRLQRLGLFSNVEVRTLEEKTSVAQRTVVVKVTDRDPGLFNMGIGATNERNLTLRGYTGVAYRNLFGTARALSLRLDLNYNIAGIQFPELKATIGYLEPYLLGSRIRGKVNYTQATYVTDYEQRTAGEVKQTIWSAEHQLNSHITLNWDAYGLAQYRDFKIDLGQNTSTVDIRNTAFSVEFDYRDHQWNPTRGVLSRIGVEYGSPELGSSHFIQYIRSTGLLTHYWRLQPKWSWANSLSVGSIRNLKQNGYVPYDKKGFVLGGPTTVRGFAPEEAFPNNKDFNGSLSYPLTTEAVMTMFKSELRFPIPVGTSFAGAIFYDSGKVDIKEISTALPYANTSGIRQSAGFAVRWFSPVEIPVSFEMGWKLGADARRGESPLAIHLSIGSF